MPTETLGFSTKEMRDEQYRRWKDEGNKGVVKYTTHTGNDPAIIWVVARTEPPAVPVPEPTDEEKIKNLLTEPEKSETIEKGESHEMVE